VHLQLVVSQEIGGLWYALNPETVQRNKQEAAKWTPVAQDVLEAIKDHHSEQG